MEESYSMCQPGNSFKGMEGRKHKKHKRGKNNNPGWGKQSIKIKRNNEL